MREASLSRCGYCERSLEPLEQSIHLGGGLGVEFPAVGLAAARVREQAALHHQVLLDREEAVEPGLQLQRDDRAHREVHAIRRVLVAALECLPHRDDAVEQVHPGHRAGDAAAEAVDQEDAARALEHRRACRRSRRGAPRASARSARPPA